MLISRFSIHSDLDSLRRAALRFSPYLADNNKLNHSSRSDRRRFPFPQPSAIFRVDNIPGYFISSAFTARSNLSKEQFSCLLNCRQNTSAVYCAVTAGSLYVFPTSCSAKIPKAIASSPRTTSTSISSPASSFFAAVPVNGNRSTRSTKLSTAPTHNRPSTAAWPILQPS
jgi:hypothetical protein